MTEFSYLIFPPYMPVWVKLRGFIPVRIVDVNRINVYDDVRLSEQLVLETLWHEGLCTNMLRYYVTINHFIIFGCFWVRKRCCTSSV